MIGVFTVEDENGNTEQRIKIIRNEKLSDNMAWNSNRQNEWSTASLNTYLNGDYYNGLDAESKNLIEKSVYYLGGCSLDLENHYGNSSNIYNCERRLTTYSGRTASWNGKIALMYAIDYSYTYAYGVDNTCNNDCSNCTINNGAIPSNSWIYTGSSGIYIWILTPRSDNLGNGTRALFISYSGYLAEKTNNSDGVDLSFGIRPTLYLSLQVKITSGDGTEQNPYQLSL